MKPITFSDPLTEEIVKLIIKSENGYFFQIIFDLVREEHATLSKNLYLECVRYLGNHCSLIYSGPLSDLMHKHLEKYKGDEEITSVLRNVKGRADHLYEIYDTPQ